MQHGSLSVASYFSLSLTTSASSSPRPLPSRIRFPVKSIYVLSRILKFPSTPGEFFAPSHSRTLASFSLATSNHRHPLPLVDPRSATIFLLFLTIPTYSNVEALEPLLTKHPTLETQGLFSRPKKVGKGHSFIIVSRPRAFTSSPLDNTK